VTIKV
jgi:hypothetical protein